ncbi:hypothetical protein ACFQ1S_21375, partial [Kibdelosporangium lantanae]
MKYLIAIYMNPDVWDNLDEDVRRQVQEGHAAFMDTIKASGEFVSTVAPPLISFDYYPLHRDGEAEEYFRCWALIRQAQAAVGLPAVGRVLQIALHRGDDTVVVGAHSGQSRG